MMNFLYFLAEQYYVEGNMLARSQFFFLAGESLLSVIDWFFHWLISSFSNDQFYIFLALQYWSGVMPEVQSFFCWGILTNRHHLIILQHT